MSISHRIKDCISNYEKYVAVMAALPDKELAKKLNLVHIQMEIAEKTKNTASLELLEIWRTQIIDARIYKMDNNISDAPNEIELAIADIETFAIKTEDRQEILYETNAAASATNRAKQKQSQEIEKNIIDKPEQLSLF